METGEARGQQRQREYQRRPAAQQWHQRVVGGADLGHFGMALVERGGGHRHHGHVHQPGQPERHHHLDIGETQHGAALIGARGRHAVLRQAGMQVQRMRHDSRADDADRQRDRLGIRQRGRDRAVQEPAPVRRRHEQFGQIGQPDRRDEAADHQFDRPKPPVAQRQQRVGDHAGGQQAGKQRQPGQQRQAERAAEELRQIGRHRRDLARPPHRPHHRAGKPVAAGLRQAGISDDAELGRQRLEQHRHHVGDQHHPEQRIIVFGAGLDVGGEIAGVHVGDRGNDGRPGKGQEAAQPPPPAGQNSRAPRPRCARSGSGVAWLIRSSLPPVVASPNRCGSSDRKV